MYVMITAFALLMPGYKPLPPLKSRLDVLLSAACKIRAKLKARVRALNPYPKP